MLGKDQTEAVLLLLRFLIALPIGAVIGGWIATRIGDRIVTFVGLMIAGGGYWLISHWHIDVLSRHHDLGFIHLPVFDTDLAIAGLGLGLVIGPLTSATLRVVPAAQHGIASAAVVVARMIGMLIGLAALTAWGLYKFNQYLQERMAALAASAPPDESPRRAADRSRHPAAAGHPRGLRDAVRRHLPGHRRGVCGRRPARVADQRAERARRRGRGHRRRRRGRADRPARCADVGGRDRD